MLATYHNHSRWSDGKAAVADIVSAAQSMKIAQLGISDHWVLHPNGTQFKWAMPTDQLADYVSAVCALQKRAARTGEVQIRLGVEADWHPHNASPLRDVLDQYPFDYIIGSVHEVHVAGFGDFMIDGSPAAWEKLAPDQVNHMHRQYWLNVKSLAQSGVFDIMAHIDLPKKFAFYPTIDLSNEIGDALDAIANSPRPLVVEINTAGWHKPCNDAYPTLNILCQCRQRNIPVTISADAHQPEHLLRDFGRAAQRLAEAGYTQVARLSQREITLEPLAEALVPATHQG